MLQLLNPLKFPNESSHHFMISTSTFISDMDDCLGFDSSHPSFQLPLLLEAYPNFELCFFISNLNWVKFPLFQVAENDSNLALLIDHFLANKDSNNHVL